MVVGIATLILLLSGRFGWFKKTSFGKRLDAEIGRLKKLEEDALLHVHNAGHKIEDGINAGIYSTFITGMTISSSRTELCEIKKI